MNSADEEELFNQKDRSERLIKVRKGQPVITYVKSSHIFFKV